MQLSRSMSRQMKFKDDRENGDIETEKACCRTPASEKVIQTDSVEKEGQRVDCINLGTAI
ncbi:hypothetical protein OUZ56_015020 [Daphnia magna]|uniref:Uncharacterized protein n=1 Tax=Daphnia magna TaxID=35525 RepID=A0ABR0ALJ2_9CRUS|nr:hypothetical protein OUZ56_015020 [Daphnia magna]